MRKASGLLLALVALAMLWATGFFDTPQDGPLSPPSAPTGLSVGVEE